MIYMTSDMKPRELREKILTEFSVNKQSIFTVNVVSFGFKHGIPIDADLVFDVRFLPNPITSSPCVHGRASMRMYRLTF